MTRLRFLAPTVWIVYLLTPVSGWGLLQGRPLSAIAGLALIAALWLWWVRRSLPLSLLALVALIAKLTLGGVLAPRGFDARYYANAKFEGAVELGTEPVTAGSTRVDPRLAFGGPGDPHLPVHFLNDIARFNFYLPTDPARESLPVSVTWDGWLHSSRATTRRIYVRSANGPVHISMGDAFNATLPPSPNEWTGYVPVKAGAQPIHITLSLPQGAARVFDAGWLVNGEERPFSGDTIYRRAVDDRQVRRDSIFRRVSLALDALLLAALAFGVVRALAGAVSRLTISVNVRDAIAVLSAIAATDALLFARPVLGAMVTLSGGDDWLSYETMARDIGLHGLWMTRGAVLGQGQPFYFQPLYAYFVAGTHWLFGDGLYGVYLVQRLLVGVTVIALWRTTAALFGERVGAAGLVAATVLVYEKVAPWSGFVLTELLFVPLVALWTLQLVRLALSERPSPTTAAGAGIVGGFAVLARSTLLGAWPITLPVLAVAMMRKATWQRAVAAFAILLTVLVAVTSLAAIRNRVVAKKSVLIASSGSINFYLGNQPPMKIEVPKAHAASYERLGLDPNVQTSIEYGRQHPREFFEGWKKKAIYTLGWFHDLAPEMERSAFYIATWIIALVGLAVWIRGASWLPTAGLAAAIPLSMALAQFVVLVVIFPTAGDRLVLPFYVLLVPYVAIALFAVRESAPRALWQFTLRMSGTRLGFLLGLAALAATGWLVVDRATALGVNVTTTLLAFIVWVGCVRGIPRLPSVVGFSYGAIAIGVCVWAASLGTGPALNAARMDVLWIALILAGAAIQSNALKGGPVAPRILGWASVAVSLGFLAFAHGQVVSMPQAVMTVLMVGSGQTPLVRWRNS